MAWELETPGKAPVKAPPKSGWVMDVPELSPVADVAASIGTGLRRAGASLADAAGGWRSRLMLEGADKALFIAGAATGRDTAPAREAINAVRAASARGGFNPEHVAQTKVGRAAQTFAEMGPNAVVAPGGLIPKALSIVLPGAGAEGAAATARMYGRADLEEPARIGGMIAGGLASAPFMGNAVRVQAVTDPVALAANAVRAKANVPQLQARLAAQREAGAQPTFASVTDAPTRGLVRAAAMRSEAGRELAEQRAEASRLNFPDRISTQARNNITDDTRPIPAVERDIDEFVRTTATPPEVSPGYSGMTTSQRLNASRDEAWAGVNGAYRAVREMGPDGAHFPIAERPRIAAAVRDGVADYHPDTVPRVTTILSKLDDMATLTVDDMFNMRRQLTNLRASADPVEAGAAARAVERIDEITDRAVEGNIVTGDPGVIEAYKAANARRREFGQTFEGNDLIHRLTERAWRGDSGQAVKIAPEDASAAIFGRGQGVANRPNLTRDLITLRNRLGEESPEWQALQQEGLARVLGRDAGTENFGASLETFRRANPELAEVLISPQQAAQIRQAQGEIRGATLDRDALRTGQGFTAPGSAEVFAADTAGMTPYRNDLARLGAVRDVEIKAGENVSAAPGVARKLAYAPEQQARNRALLGDEGAARFEGGMAAEYETNAALQDVAPSRGSQTQPRSVDDQRLEAVVQGGKDGLKLITGGVAGWLDVLASRAKSLGLNNEQAEALAKVATDPAQVDDIIAGILKQPNGEFWATELRKLIENTRQGLPYTPGTLGGATSQAQTMLAGQ